MEFLYVTACGKCSYRYVLKARLFINPLLKAMLFRSIDLLMQGFSNMDR